MLGTSSTNFIWENNSFKKFDNLPTWVNFVTFANRPRILSIKSTTSVTIFCGVAKGIKFNDYEQGGLKMVDVKILPSLEVNLE